MTVAVTDDVPEGGVKQSQALLTSPREYLLKSEGRSHDFFELNTLEKLLSRSWWEETSLKQPSDTEPQDPLEEPELEDPDFPAPEPEEPEPEPEPEEPPLFDGPPLRGKTEALAVARRSAGRSVGRCIIVDVSVNECG